MLQMVGYSKESRDDSISNDFIIQRFGNGGGGEDVEIPMFCPSCTGMNHRRVQANSEEIMGRQTSDVGWPGHRVTND